MVVRRVSAKVFRRMAEARGASVASAAGRPGRGRGAGGSARGRAAAVREIIGAVRRRGDEALIEYAARFDGVGLSLDGLTLGSEAIAAGARACPPEMREALALAMANIDAFHRRQVIGSWWEQGSADGGLWRGQLVRPLDSVGLYVPGGTAAYPSTVLMGAVPARVAGVRRVVICTPPLGDGSVPASVLAAAELCGITEIHPVGGAQAVAALAYGTAAVRKVDKIIGPGNAYVAEAKRQVAGDVGIDAIAGPSEVLIIADETADPALLAADLLAQAEHDALAVPVLIATSGALLERTAAELEAQVARMSRQAIARQALAGQGALVLVKSLDEAVELAGLFAPEHLELQVADAFALLPAVRHAGSVFLGRLTAEAFGDYAAGVNHVLPTSGTARFASSLGVADFTVRSQALAVTPAGAAALDRASTVMARSEGLEGHALAVEARRAAVGVEPGGVAPAAAPAATVAPAAPEFERSLAAGAREVFAAWGYREVGAPLFLPLEDLDPALGSNGLRDRLFKFVDPSGRIMVVRPDWTLPVARGAVAALRSGSAPMRLSYAGDVYRRGSRASALSRGGSGDWEGARIPQAGVELLGLKTTWADAELVTMAVEVLERCGLDGFTVCVGHAALAEALLAGLGADSATVKAMRAALVDRDLVAWERLLARPGVEAGRAAAARALVAHRGDARGLAEAVDAASAFGREVTDHLGRLGEFASILGVGGAAGRVVFDLGLVRDLDYYSGLVFEAYATGCGRPVLTGGRYDGLLSSFGLDCPAVGLGVEVDALAEALAAQGGAAGLTPPPLRTVEVGAGREIEAFTLAAGLRGLGLRVELRAEPRAGGQADGRTERAAAAVKGGGRR